MNTHFLSIVLLLTAISAAAQPPDSLWSRSFGGPQDDNCYAMQQTGDGGYILAGSTNSFGAGGYDFWIVKTDVNGDSLWSRTFGGSADDQCYSVQQTTDGGYVLAGTTRSFGAGGYDYWLIKTDDMGLLQWSRTFGGMNQEWCNSVQQTADGGYILAGCTTSFGAGFQDFWLVKTDAHGDSLWSRTYGGDRISGCNSVAQIPDGGYILAGVTYLRGAGGSDCWLIKTNSSGDSLWSRTFGSAGDDDCNAVIPTVNGGFALAGAGAFLMLKTDSAGLLDWSQSGSGEYGPDAGVSIGNCTDGGYFLAGSRLNSEAFEYDFALAKTDSIGNPLWSRTFDGGAVSYCYASAQTSDGGYLLAGHLFVSNASNYNFWIVKTAPEEMAVNPAIRIIPRKNTLCSAYPNPFNGSTRIRYDLDRQSKVQLQIFDLQGRLVTTLLDDISKPGQHEIHWNADNLSSGTYFVRLQTPSDVHTEKLLLLK
jgi:hypothetical protein